MSMPINVSTRDKRTLGIGIAIVGALLIIGKGGPAWRRWDDTQRADAVQHVRQLTMLREGMTQLHAMRDSTAARARRVNALMGHLLIASSVPQAAAALASALTQDANWAGIRLSTVSVRPDSAARNGFARVGVRIDADGDVDGLTRFLRRAESNNLLLAVRDLTVNQPNPGGPDSTAETLRIDLLVEALARIDTVASKAERQ